MCNKAINSDCRKEALAWADRVNQLEGLPAPTAHDRRFDDAVIAGIMTHEEAIQELLKDYKS